MKGMHSLGAAFCATALVALACLTQQASAAVEEISRQGKYLVRPNGERFYIKGVAYQEQAASAEQTDESLAQGGFPEPDTFTDPLSLGDQCERDIENLRNLGVNTVHVYSVNASLNHDDCMNLFNDNNMHVIIDLSLPLNGSINRANPVWDTALFQLYVDTASAFMNYDNVLAFNVGNEVVTTDENTVALPFVRAAARDMRNFLDSQGHENILLGYSAADGPAGASSRRAEVAQYLTCDPEARVDLYGLNSYSWVGDSSFEEAGYDQLVSDFENLPVPAYFSEFGGVGGSGPDGRLWTEVPALFSTPMTDVFSGGVAFQYFPNNAEAGGLDYSLTTQNGDTFEPRENFNLLAEQFTTVNGPAELPAGADENPTLECPSQSDSLLASSELPPTPNAERCMCASESAFRCQASQSLVNSPAQIGELLGTVCSLPGGDGFSCDDIAADGATGEYGPWSSCSPVQRLDWALSAYYSSLVSTQPGACDFGGNATLVNLPSMNGAASATEDALQQCLDADPVDSDYVPPANTNTGGGGTGGGSGSGSNDDAENGAQASAAIGGAMLGLVLAMTAALVL